MPNVDVLRGGRAGPPPLEVNGEGDEEDGDGEALGPATVAAVDRKKADPVDVLGGRFGNGGVGRWSHAVPKSEEAELAAAAAAAFDEEGS